MWEIQRQWDEGRQIQIWRRTDILTFSWRTLGFHIQGLTSLLPWREVLNRGSLYLSTYVGDRWPLAGALQTSWLPDRVPETDWPLLSGYLHIWFHNAHAFPVVNPCEPLPLINYIMNEYSKVAQREYKTRYDRELYKKLKFFHTSR